MVSARILIDFTPWNGIMAIPNLSITVSFSHDNYYHLQFFEIYLNLYGEVLAFKDTPDMTSPISYNCRSQCQYLQNLNEYPKISLMAIWWTKFNLFASFLFCFGHHLFMRRVYHGCGSLLDVVWFLRIHEVSLHFLSNQSTSTFCLQGLPYKPSNLDNQKTSCLNSACILNRVHVSWSHKFSYFPTPVPIYWSLAPTHYSNLWP